MKTKYTLILCLVIFILWSFPTVNAQNSQGLSWGVQNGTHVYYQVDFVSDSLVEDLASIQEIIYIIIQDLPEIPEYVNGFADFMQYNLTTYWENGTRVYSDYLGFYQIPVFPIGNWTLYSELILERNSWQNYSIEIIDTLEIWGFKQRINQTTLAIEASYEFSKIDGCLRHSLLVSQDITYGEIIIRNEITRVEVNLPILLASGVIIGVEIIIVTIIFKKFKARTVKELESDGTMLEDVLPS